MFFRNHNKEETKITILLTGATGYLGSHILARMVAAKHEVLVLKRSFSNTSRIETFLPSCISYDIDKVSLTSIFDSHSVDLILHCATNYGRKETDPLQTVEANLLLPLQLLELGRKTGVRAFVNTDTILDKGVNNYSLSKSQFRDWLNEYSTDMMCCNVALEHFYGPLDDTSKFVSFIVSSFIESKDRISLTPGYQKRDFIFIEDVVDAFGRIIEKSLTSPKGYYPFEVGTGDPVSIRHLVCLIKELSGNTTTEIGFGDISYRANEVMDCKTDLRAISETGWTSQYSLVEGLKLTIKREKEARGS